MDKRYSILPYMQKRWEKVGKKMAFQAKNQKEWTDWSLELSAILKQLSGYDTMQKCSLDPVFTEQKEFDNYIRQHVVIQTEPGVYMPMYILIPKNQRGPFSVVIAPHGHYSGGKLAVAHCDDIPEVHMSIQTYNYIYGLQFVHAGFIVFCPDARGFGERREPFGEEGLLDSSCEILNHMAYPLGQTVTGMWTWDIHRLVDYIQTRSDCLPNMIGCAGLSGGGLQTLWAAALDERIRCAIISGYFYGYKEALLELPQNCSCNYVPKLYEYVDMGDIAALIAPRPVLIESGMMDPLNGARGIENVVSQVEIARNAYRVFNCEHLFKHVVFEGEHRWNGQDAVTWMKQSLIQTNR